MHPNPFIILMHHLPHVPLKGCVEASFYVTISCLLLLITVTKLTRKRFSEKPIVAFTSSTVLNFILDFYNYV